MIKNGNYKFLDFDKHKEKFIDVFVEYYGKEHEKIIRERMDSITYVPYLNYIYLSDYFSKRLNNYRDEIIAEYCKITGRKHLSETMKKLIFSEGGSKFFLATQEGENLDECLFLGERRDEIQKIRDKIARKFKMNGSDPFKQIRKETRNIRQAISNVEKKHPCEVFDDVDRVIKNRNTATQMFLSHVNKYYLPLTDEDIELLQKPEFDSYDRESLDCKWVLFGDMLELPGLVSSFTTESDEKANTDINGCIEVYASRVSLFVLNNGVESLQFVTPEELFGDIKDVEDKEEFAGRLAQELEQYIQNNPEIWISPEIADAIENARKMFVNNMYVGCKFAGKLNSSYQQSVHSVDDENQWLTYLEFDAGHVDYPKNIIFFDETQHMDVYRLQENLIHEINHAIGHGKAIIDKDKKKAYSYTGMAGYLRNLYDGQYIDEYLGQNEAILQVEENFNERMTEEIAEIFEAKYGCVYEPSDIDLMTEDDYDWECAYNYFSFMTEKFWNKYRDAVKEHRISEDSEKSTIFYDHDKRPPMGEKEYIRNFREYKRLKRNNPDALIQRGTINYDMLNELGNLIVHFRDNEQKQLYRVKDLHADDLFGDIRHFEGVDENLATTIDAYKIVADEIFDRMEKEELSIYRSKDIHDKIKNILTFKGNNGLIDSIRKHISIRKKTPEERTTSDLEDESIVESIRKKALKKIRKESKEDESQNEME